MSALSCWQIRHHTAFGFSFVARPDMYCNAALAARRGFLGADIPPVFHMIFRKAQKPFSSFSFNKERFGKK